MSDCQFAASVLDTSTVLQAYVSCLHYLVILTQSESLDASGSDPELL